MKIKSVAILILLLSLRQYLFSQIYFSQFYSSPLTINPANTGKFDGDYRAGGVFRSAKDQVSSDSKGSFFFDTHLLASSLPENDKLSIGLAAVSEKNNYFGINNNFLLLSLSYHMALNQDGTELLGIGFQGGVAHQQIDNHNLVFESDLRNNGFVWNGSFITQVNVGYADFSVGADYQNLWNEKNLVTAGVALYHASRPYKIVNNTVFTLPRQISLQAGWDHTIDERSKLKYYFLAGGTPDDHTLNDILVSCLYQTRINESDYRIEFGGGVRRNYLTGTAVTPCVGLLYDTFVLHVSYEVTVTGKSTDQRGGMEAGLVYTGRRAAKK
jgi:type IX secretion system PorP/SprF family membrane protein